jgi:transposase-like protein
VTVQDPSSRRRPVKDDDASAAVDGGTAVDWDDLLAQLAEQPGHEGWVTLEEASGATGVARSTLRSWYRTGQVPSRMVAGIHGPQRLVPLDVVLDRALRSSRIRRQLQQATSLEAEVKELRQRLEAIERHLGLE